MYMRDERPAEEALPDFLTTALQVTQPWSIQLFIPSFYHICTMYIQYRDVYNICILYTVWSKKKL